jgi:hypothetical protein
MGSPEIGSMIYAVYSMAAWYPMFLVTFEEEESS